MYYFYMCLCSVKVDLSLCLSAFLESWRGNCWADLDYGCACSFDSLCLAPSWQESYDYYYRPRLEFSFILVAEVKHIAKKLILQSHFGSVDASLQVNQAYRTHSLLKVWAMRLVTIDFNSLAETT